MAEPEDSGRGGAAGSRSPREEEAPSTRAPRLNLTIDDFQVLGRIGEGSFSTVALVRRKGGDTLYALKIINKHLIMRNKMVEYIKQERNILDRLDYDGIAKLFFTFQDTDSLYMGLEYCPGGELYDFMQKAALPLDLARFYAAEMVCILEYLRRAEVVHRDLKPENLLLSAGGHLKLVDFGSAKAFCMPQLRRSTSSARATSFVGTAEYVSPEVLKNTGVSFAMDLWALGCIVFQMLAGRPPFKGDSEYLTFQLVTAGEFEFPENFDAHAKDLVSKLLEAEPDDRLGATNFEDLKRHPFFQDITWENLWHVPPPGGFTPPQRRGEAPEVEGFDWELSSLRRGAAPHYEFADNSQAHIQTCESK